MKPLLWDALNPFTGQPFTWDDPNLRWGDPAYYLEPGDPGFVPYPGQTASHPTLKPKRKRMAKSDYIAQNDDLFAAQLQTFKTGIGAYATVAIAIVILASSIQAQTPKALPKPSPSDIRVLPFCGTKKDLKIDPKTKGIFDELSVTKSGRIHIHGTKQEDSGRINGEVVYHIGKIVMIPTDDRTGKLVAKLGSQQSVRRYFMGLELEDKLQTEELMLKEGQIYDWSVKSENGNTTFKITAGQAAVATVTAPTAQVKGVGFAAAVRFTKNKADLEVTFD